MNCILNLSIDATLVKQQFMAIIEAVGRDPGKTDRVLQMLETTSIDELLDMRKHGMVSNAGGLKYIVKAELRGTFMRALNLTM